MESIISIKKEYEELEKSFEQDLRTLNSIILFSDEDLEGNCYYHWSNPGVGFISDWSFIYKRLNYYSLLKKRQSKKIIEIGFNAGHSALVFLNSMEKDSSLLIFDLCEHTYTESAFSFLKSKYPQVRDLIKGDSRTSIKKWILDNREEIGTFDIIHIDGGHEKEIISYDILHTDALLKPGGILILDDTQLGEVNQFILSLIQMNYSFIYQIPTFGFSHCFLQKSF